MMRAAVRQIVPFFALALAACGTEPQYTAYEATLISPHNLDGAAVIELDGEFADAVTPVSGQVFTHANGGVTRVVVVLPTPGTIGFMLNLDAAGEPPDARVIEVADGSNTLRTSPGDYLVTFRGIEP